MNILLVIVKYKSGKQPVKLYFTTDLGLKLELVVTYYKLRFQIEFLYRDGNQSTGQCHCQARSENKLDFHFNASLAAINVTKVEDWLSITKDVSADKVRTNLTMAILTAMGYFLMRKSNVVANGCTDAKKICLKVGNDVPHGNSRSHTCYVPGTITMSLRNL